MERNHYLLRLYKTYNMLTTEIKSKVQRLWDMFWSRGITNPITAIEQISYLLFIRRLEEIDEYNNVTEDRGKSIFDGHEVCKWKNFSNLNPEEMLDCYRNTVFPFIKSLSSDDEPFSIYMRDAVNEISKPSLMYDAVKMIDYIYQDIEKGRETGQHFQDVQGDIYEFLINEISSSGKNGQFRTPRHIIQFICDLINPDVNDTICDPACGTGGFLLGAFQRILTNHTPSEKQIIDENGLSRYANSFDAVLDNEAKKKISTSIFYGFDIDKTMVRIGLMNLMLHGISHPNIECLDTLSTAYDNNDRKYSVVMANPPFTGIVSMDDLSMDLRGNGKKSEFLFLLRIIKMLQNGGRAAVIVPDGVLFSSNKNAQKVRKQLLHDCSLTAVISLPSGVFKPYAGVKTSILFFTKIEDNSIVMHTDDIWFYELSNDGYSLDDNRHKLKENPLPQAEKDFAIRKNLQTKTRRFFHLSINEIDNKNYYLHFDKYKLYEEVSVEVRAPNVLLKAILELEESLKNDLNQLSDMI